jgi:predicted MFS family arabinose efflux permease
MLVRMSTDAAAQPPRPRRPSPFRAFRHRDYTLLWFGMFMGSALMPMQFVTQVLFLSERAGNNRLVLAGLLGATRGAAMLTFALFGGVLADRYDRRRLLMVSQSLGFCVSVLVTIVLLTTPGGTTLTLALFIGLVFLASGLGAVDAPTRLAMVPELVGREDLPNAIALDAVAMQLAFPIGLPLTGVLIDLIGYGWTYAVTLGTYAAIILALIPMTYRGTTRVARAGRSMIGDVRFGLSYARRHPALLWMMLTSFCVTGMTVPVVTNLGPVWTNRVLGLSATGVGALAMTWGIGAMVGSIAMTNVGHFRSKGWLFLGAAAGFDCFVIGFGYSRLVPVSAVLNLGLGAMLTICSVSATSLTQRLIPNEVQGRVMSIFMLSSGLAQLLTLPIGGIAQWATFELTMPVIGWTSLIAVVLITVLQPVVRRAGRLAEATELIEV